MNVEREREREREIVTVLIVGHNEGSGIEHGHILQCSYNKLAVGSSSLEANIIGLWSGSYGPHGIEIINVTHTDEGIVGTKVLGIMQHNIVKITFNIIAQFILRFGG